MVFSELYRALAARPKDAALLNDRLCQVGLDVAWFAEAADSYEAKWDETRSQPAPFALEPDHTLLAGWILAGMRRTGPSHDVSDELLKRMRARAAERPCGITNPLPAALNVRVVAWTLGQVVGDIDRDLPFVPVRPPRDPHVAAAYGGLVEYCLQLKAVIREPWPELIGTATFVRGLGLAEALKPDVGSYKEGKARPALKALIQEARLVLPELEFNKLQRHFLVNDFVSTRNTLSHVAPDPDKPTFVDLVDVARTWDDVAPTVSGVTQFVCQQISNELHGSREVDPSLWDRIRWDLEVYV
ncbi:hypothetical protein [Georgenia yuyongxinii]